MNVIGIVHVIHEKFVKQLDGSKYAGLNCTMASAAMAGYRHTLGLKALTGGFLRRLSGDTMGGTTLDQAKYALGRAGVLGMDGPYRGIPMLAFYTRLRGGRGSMVQGSSLATINTKYQASTTFIGNHCWYVARGVEWFRSGATWLPAFLIVYDPLADGRRPGIAHSPLKMPRPYFEKFCRLLSFGSYLLGPGKVYALFTKVTMPHRHATYGGVAIARTRLRLRPGYNLRRKPATGTPSVIRKTRADEYFDAWQRKSDGPLLGHSRVWYGDHSGTKWIHASAVA